MLLISINTTGQMCNRLFAFAHLIAWALENNGRILNLSFFDQRPFFQGSRDGWWAAWPPGRWQVTEVPKLRGLVLRLRAWFTSLLLGLLSGGQTAEWLRRRGWLIAKPMDTYLDLEGPEFAAASQRPFLFINAWQARCDNLLHRHAEAIRGYFKPCEPQRSQAEAMARAARGGAEILVGVHLRAGDYRNWRGGEFFFTSGCYERWMDEMKVLLPGRTLAFLVASNEPLPETLASRPDVTAADGDAVEDLLALSACDYLLGPPSTFTGWASFFGQVPLCPLRNSGQVLSLASFSPFRSIAELYTGSPVPKYLACDCR